MENRIDLNKLAKEFVSIKDKLGSKEAGRHLIDTLGVEKAFNKDVIAALKGKVDILRSSAKITDEDGLAG